MYIKKSNMHAIYLPFLFSFRFSRRKILTMTFIAAAVGSIGAILLSDKAEFDQGNILTRCPWQIK